METAFHELHIKVAYELCYTDRGLITRWHCGGSLFYIVIRKDNKELSFPTHTGNVLKGFYFPVLGLATKNKEKKTEIRSYNVYEQ